MAANLVEALKKIGVVAKPVKGHPDTITLGNVGPFMYPEQIVSALHAIGFEMTRLPIREGSKVKQYGQMISVHYIAEIDPTRFNMKVKFTKLP